MGFLDWLFGRQDCPYCNTPGARRSDAGVRCPNPACQYFDSSLAKRGTLRSAGTSIPRRGNFSPAKPLSIRYENFRGEVRNFVAETETVQRRRNHIVVRVAPTGEKISLARNRIQNLREVEAVLPQRVSPGQPWPSPRERQVLSYHKKYGTTSPLYEKIRAKYPDW